MSVHRLPERAAASLALPTVEAVDQLDRDGLLDFLTQSGALIERARARLTLASEQRVGDGQRGAVAEPWLDTKQAAAALQVPVSWIAEKARQGQLRSHRLGHYVRFRRVELEADAAALATRAERE